MGILLLFSLSCFFGYVFTAHHKSTIAKLQRKLEREKSMRNIDRETHELQLNKLRNTIREMLRG